MKDYRERLERGIFEIVIITISILLAFALERWWDRQLDTGSREELVSSLVLEFEATAEDLKYALQTHESRRRGALALSQIQADTIESVDPDMISQYWYWAVTPDETFPPSGVLQSAISSGSLSLIGSEKLTSKLASWSDRLNNFTQTERVLADYTAQVFWPSVAQDVFIPLNKEKIGRETDEVILKPSTRNHLNFLVLGSDVAIGQVQELQQEVDEILELLKIESG